MAGSLLILGASARAAAQSAARLGLRAYCGDLFCDADLPDSAVGKVARSFPRDLARIAAQAPAGPWMYTGGLENYPTAVALVSRRHELLGAAADALRRMRDPFELGRVLDRAGMQCPECRDGNLRVSRDGSWLAKHRRSSGGLRVVAWHGQASCPTGPGWYFQRRVEGLPIGAVFVAAGGRARLLGITEQILTGTGKRPFQYGGSIGPVELSPCQHQGVVSVGRVLAAEFALRGLFGVNLIVAADGVWVIEVNPRYTASVEVLERALGFNAVEVQFSACRDARLPEVEMQATRWVGKSTVYADRAVELSAGSVGSMLAHNVDQVWPMVADIPRAGTLIETGQPVLTVFAHGPNPSSLRVRLQVQIDTIRQEVGV